MKGSRYCTCYHKTSIYCGLWPNYFKMVWFALNICWFVGFHGYLDMKLIYEKLVYILPNLFYEFTNNISRMIRRSGEPWCMQMIEFFPRSCGLWHGEGWLNCKKAATSENQGQMLGIIYGLRGVCLVIGWGRVDDLSFFDYSSPSCFFLIEFHSYFSISYKILTDYVYY